MPHPGGTTNGGSSKPDGSQPKGGLLEELTDRVVGQAHAMEQIVPYVQMHRAGLAPEGRPAGVFLLLGPTGTGKTRTVEALAEVLHGSELLRGLRGIPDGA